MVAEPTSKPTSARPLVGCRCFRRPEGEHSEMNADLETNERPLVLVPEHLGYPRRVDVDLRSHRRGQQCGELVSR